MNKLEGFKGVYEEFNKALTYLVILNTDSLFETCKEYLRL